MTRSRLLPIESPATGTRRWLLEVFELRDPCLGAFGAPARHAVWLSRLGSSWRWWCYCGCLPGEGSDLVGVLTGARMHFDAVSLVGTSSVPIAHPIAAWSDRAIGKPAGDDVAVAGLARLLS